MGSSRGSLRQKPALNGGMNEKLEKQVIIFKGMKSREHNYRKCILQVVGQPFDESKSKCVRRTKGRFDEGDESDEDFGLKGNFHFTPNLSWVFSTESRCSRDVFPSTPRFPRAGARSGGGSHFSFSTAFL